LQASADALGAYPDGVWLVELAPLSEPSLVEQQLATVLRIREDAGTSGPGGQTLTDRLVDYLAARRTLVLLDNCEHLVAACAALSARLVGACPDLTVLATSREPLGVAGEVTFGVPPLAVDSLDPAEIGGVEAVRLFVDRAGLVDPAFGLTSENAAAVVSVCRRLDGIPLAIELAAARTRSLSPQQLDARLSDRFRLLAGGSHGVAVVTIQIGLCALEGGDQHEARALVREGLQLARELECRWGELYGLDGAALLAARTSNWEVAATLLGATELLREASPAPQIRVRETAIAAVKPAIDPTPCPRCGTRAKPYPWTRQPPTHSSISSHRIRHNL
jgi:hypothetical protein